MLSQHKRSYFEPAPLGNPWNLSYVRTIRWSSEDSSFLTFMGPCVVNTFQYISKEMQLYTVYLYLKTALRVSGGTSTHHQDRTQLYLQHLVFVTPLLLSAAIVNATCRTHLYLQHLVFATPLLLSAANNCIYSIWYLSHRYCYLPLSRQVAITVWQIPTFTLLGRSLTSSLRACLVFPMCATWEVTDYTKNIGKKVKESLHRPWKFQKAETPIFPHSRHMEVVKTNRCTTYNSGHGFAALTLRGMALKWNCRTPSYTTFSRKTNQSKACKSWLLLSRDIRA
jgi:hypothetical protein